MSIASEITRLQTAKADIKTAIEAKGVTVPANAKLDDYNTYVANIPTGGGTNNLPAYIDGSITTISQSDFGNATSIRPYAFACIKRIADGTNVIIPSTITRVGTNAFREFGNDSTGETITLTFNSVTKFESNIASSCHFGNLVINSSVDVDFTNRAFYSSTNLRTVTINTPNTALSNYCFADCTYLTTVNLPALTFLNEHLFDGCTRLTTINYAGTMADWNAAYKMGNWNVNVPATVVHCSDGDVTL